MESGQDSNRKFALLFIGGIILVLLLFGSGVVFGPQLVRVQTRSGSGDRASDRALTIARSALNAEKPAVPGKLTMGQLADLLGGRFADAFWADPVLRSAWKDFEADGDAEKFQRQAGQKLEPLVDRFGPGSYSSARRGAAAAGASPQDSISMIGGEEGAAPDSSPSGRSPSGRTGEEGPIDPEAAAGIAGSSEKAPDPRGKEGAHDVVPKAHVPNIETYVEVGRQGRPEQNVSKRRHANADYKSKRLKVNSGPDNVTGQ